MLYARKALAVGVLVAATLTTSTGHAVASPVLAPGSFAPVLDKDEELIVLAGWLNAHDELPLADAVHLESIVGDLRGQILTAQIAASTPFPVSGPARLASQLAATASSLSQIQDYVSTSTTMAVGPRSELSPRLAALSATLDALTKQPPVSVVPSSFDSLLSADEDLLLVTGSLQNAGQLNLADTFYLEQSLGDLRGQIVSAQSTAATPLNPPFSADLVSLVETAEKSLTDIEHYVTSSTTISVPAQGEFDVRIRALAAALATIPKQTAAPRGITVSGLSLHQLTGQPGANAVIMATVSYDGPQPAEPVSLAVSLDDGASGQGRLDEVNLQPGQPVTVFVRVNLPVSASGDLALSLTARDAAGSVIGSATGQVHLADLSSAPAPDQQSCTTTFCYTVDASGVAPSPGG